MVSAPTVHAGPKTREPITDVAEQYRKPHDYLYLLVDGQAECALDHPLSVPSLSASAVTRVLRPDLSHTPEICPALIQLAAPGEAVSPRYLALSADYAESDLGYNQRYICGWLASEQPLEVIASHFATRCETTASEDGWPSPWFEPLRLELLIGAMGTQAGDLLGPIRFWLFPSSWEGYSLIRDARRLGLKDSRDLIALSLHRVFYHPDLPQHPDIQKAIAQARAGDMGLQSNFREYTPNDWKRVVAKLPRAEDYS